jgi:hypothetical protein
MPSGLTPEWPAPVRWGLPAVLATLLALPVLLLLADRMVPLPQKTGALHPW